MKEIYKPYGIDVKREIKTYLNVGIDFENAKVANNSLQFNFRRWIRKKFTNKKEKSYVFCDTYGEWKKHIIESVIPSTMTCETRINLYHWVKKKKELAEICLSVHKNITVPVCLVIVELFDEMIQVYLVLIFACLFWTLSYYRYYREVNFWDDFLSLIES